MPERRRLSFDQLSLVMPEVDRLLQGYDRVGNWTLGQTCQHLTRSLTRTVDGLPGGVPRIVRRTIGRWLGRRLLSSGKMPSGLKIKPSWRIAPDSDLDDRAEVEALRGALQYYAGLPGPFPEHPFFGPLSRADWDRLHCVHCAHHLSFLLPIPPTANQAGHG